MSSRLKPGLQRRTTPQHRALDKDCRTVTQRTRQLNHAEIYNADDFVVGASSERQLMPSARRLACNER
jgi:hypothetical protein